MTFLAGISVASAQEQERKLVNRLLRPDMALVNSAQNKQFAAAGTLVAKDAPSKNFYPPDRPLSKSFAAEREFHSRQFATSTFPSANAAANISARSQVAKTDIVEIASAPDAARVAPESARNSLATTPFAGSRPFLGRGKSQKTLSAGGTPLTLEQVRELLNKNK